MRVLFCTGSPARYMAPPRLSDEQVNAGPDWNDHSIGGHVISLATARGDYDIAALVARLPAEQQPDVVVCLVDAAWRSTPRNLKALACPKVLLVADTHHLNGPINGMIDYARSEPFDRIVLLYDRHHAPLFRAAGLRDLFWFPGLTFPHSDAAVFAARTTGERTAELAFIGQTGICHPRRTQALTHLLASQQPLSLHAVGQRESLALYGRSLIGFNASLNGDFNLRTFEILAGGAMLLTDQLGQGSGLSELWTSGREIVTYASSAEMVECTKHALAHPAETLAIGRAGAQWFDTHFNEQRRRDAFQRLVFDGVPHPAFVLPAPAPSLVTSGAPALSEAMRKRLTTGYEYVQELHRNLDRVVVAVDESTPDEFVRWCATLPRVEIVRGLPGKGQRVDLLVVGRGNFESPTLVAAVHVWPWEAHEADRQTLVRRCTSMGFALVENAALIFSRAAVNTHANPGAVALVRLEQGEYADATNLAKIELNKNPKSVDALIVLCEISQEAGNKPVAQNFARQIHALAPAHPRLRQILTATKEAVQARRPNRLLKVARAHVDQRNWPEVAKLARQVLALDAQSAEAHFLLGLSVAPEGTIEHAAALLGAATRLAPTRAEYWHELASVLRRHERNADALGAAMQAATLEPDNFLYQLALGETALQAGHGAIAREALLAATQLQPKHQRAARWLTEADALVVRCDYARPRDVLFSHVEVTRLQGTGVLLQRFFPDATDFVTLRSRTLYQGKVDFGGAHFSLDLPGLTEEARTATVKRLLAPFTIRRLLCVPFFATDFLHALAARELTGAPLCTYVMDDQVLHSRAVPQELAQRLFAASDLRLAISAEMIAEYSAWFQCDFGLLPPIVTTRDDEAPNHWTARADSARHCVMVGNIWSAKQFEQLRTFTRAAGLKVDWFGNANVSWLPQDKSALEADGIYCRGFLPESELARQLAGYPFVLLPSGTLDGTEDNEWLTRLSLPSRMVFIVTKTFTPMLVLGSERTAAARFVEQFGLGVSSNYDANEAVAKIEQLTTTTSRATFLANAQRVAPHFLMPGCGEWIWRSLAAKRALPTPFGRLYAQAGDGDFEGGNESAAVVVNPSDAESPVAEPESFARKLAAIVPQLADAAVLESYYPPNEPRQKADVRGGVWFLRAALREFGPLAVRLIAIERLALLMPRFRPVLVAWAELLEEAGKLPEAAEKARKSLSLFYDDVYTQTLFMRCAGEVNHHANGKDLFCARPFRNFEIYEDGSVHVCNCTCVPFPVGNATTQTAEEIWQSPVAQAVRASILDGSFRFCSPMTCPWRFALPKRSERPAEFAKLQALGIDGKGQPPQHLNLSYDRSCNLSCPSCRNQLLMANADQRKKNELIRDRVVMPLLETAETVYITGSGDAFGSPHFRGILKQLCDPRYKVEIILGTNGQLITPRLWEEFSPLHARFRDVTISIDGATPETFERLRRGSSWEKLQVTMGVLQVARQTRAIRRLKVNMVVQTENFMEMRPLLALCRAWAVDAVCFYRLRQWGNIVPGHYLASDITNPLHPRHAELLAELAHPDFAHGIVDHYDMYELIAKAQADRLAREAVAPTALPASMPAILPEPVLA